MKADEIFRKTPIGQSEVDAMTDALSMEERRVLILVNGDNNAKRIKQLSLCDNIVEILDNLVDKGFIESTDGNFHLEDSTEADEDFSDAKDFMCNTLLSFANRVRVGKLLNDIGAAKDVKALQALVKPWYIALSETPGGMYQADDMRKELLHLIGN